MIKEVTNSIKAVFYERISSPIYGTYIFSWLLYNWQLTVPLILGEDDFDKRFNSFQSNLFVEESFAWGTIAYPIVFTAIILILQPLAYRFLFIYSTWNKTEGLKKRDEFESETRLSIDQSNQIRQSVRNINDFHQKTIQSKDEEITTLKEGIESREKAVQKTLSEISDLHTQNTNMSSDLARYENTIQELTKKTERLAKILSAQRQRRFSNIKWFTGWFIGHKYKNEFPDFVGSNDRPGFNEIDEENIKMMLSMSSSESWKQSCYLILIQRFGGSWSFDMANKYFDKLIKPYARNYSNENIDKLIHFMDTNPQISERNRASQDKNIILSIKNEKAI